MGEEHPLLQWFRSKGVKLHPSLYLEQDAKTGLSFYTAQPLGRDTMIIQVPSRLCITSTSAREDTQLILTCITGSRCVLEAESLPAPDWILLYLILNRLAEEFIAVAEEEGCTHDMADRFPHLPYVSHIPKMIETPLHFSPAEMELLSNTPLVGSTERRLRETIVDYERAHSLITCRLVQGTARHPFAKHLLANLHRVGPGLLESDALMRRTYHKGLELWRWAESAFTSRSFPPRLIGLSDARDSDTGSSSGVSAPILIPAYDTFNHARAHPVTWNTSPSNHTAPTHGNAIEAMVGLTINYDLPSAPCQVFNNYGGKSNEEFLAAYGFTLDTFTEDTLALKLGSETKSHSHQPKTHYWLIPPSTSTHDGASAQDGNPRSTAFVRSPCPCPSLLSELQLTILQGESPPSSDHQHLELYATLLETLESLLVSKRKAFRTSQTLVNQLNTHLAFATPQDLRPQHCIRYPDFPDIPTTHLIRPSVYNNVQRYRTGQLLLLNHAITWTRTELERLAETLDT